MHGFLNVHVRYKKPRGPRGEKSLELEENKKLFLKGFSWNLVYKTSKMDQNWKVFMVFENQVHK